MPPKQKITKETLLEHAFEIAKEKGIDAVTSRSVAKSAGCSIQPVAYRQQYYSIPEI